MIKNRSPPSGRQVAGRALCRPRRGLAFFLIHRPRVPLAKPRSTLGYMPAPAPRAHLFSSRFVVFSVTLGGERISAVVLRCGVKRDMGMS